MEVYDMAARRPPKTRQKLSGEARAELGLSRRCDGCDEIKDVSNKAFCLSKRPGRSLRGWATTCRVCQGVENLIQTSHPAVIPNHAVLTGARDDFHSREALIAKMYLLNPRTHRAELEEVKDALGALVKSLEPRESLHLFIRILKPLIAEWKDPGAIHDDILDGLLSEHRRTLIIATRYSAKSTLTSMYVAWKIFRQPMIKILVVSRGASLAKRMLRTVRIVYFENCPLLEHLLPTEECLDNAEQFQTPQSLKVATGGVTFTSVGLTSNIVGLRSDETIADDVEGPADDTPEKVVALEEILNELHMINPKGRKVMLGTYQSEFSVYAKLADLEDREGVPIWEEHRALMFSEEMDQAGRATITSRWVGMFTDADGEDWRKSVTARAWRLHALLEADPSILHEKPLKIGDLILVDLSPQSREFPLQVERGGTHRADIGTWSAPKGDHWVGPRSISTESAPYVTTVCAVDPASGLAGRDAIGVAILSITQQGLGVIRHIEGVRRASKAESMRRVAQIIRDFAVSQLVVEETAEGFFGETLEGELVLLGYPMVVEKVTTGIKSKGRRIIEALAPPMGAGRLVILEAVARSDHGGEFVSQLTRVQYDPVSGKARKKHDDLVDALAHAVAAQKHSLIADFADNLAEHRITGLDRWRDRPIRWGGLGTHAGDIPGRGAPAGASWDDPRLFRADVAHLPLGERLVEEDENLVRMEARRDNMQSAVLEDLQHGRQPDQGLIRRIRHLTSQIKDLKSTQVI